MAGCVWLERKLNKPIERKSCGDVMLEKIDAAKEEQKEVPHNESQIATFATIFFSMILVNNYVLVQFLGICPFLGVSKKLDSSAGMGAAVIVVMVIATAVTFPLQIFLLDAYNLGYLQTIIFILVIAVLVQLIEITLKKVRPRRCISPWASTCR